MELAGAVTVVSGAARGIGRAIAEAYAARGARLALVDILTDELQQTAAEIRASGAAVLAVQADVTDVPQVDGMVASVERELGPIDVQINNAGTFSYIGPVWEADPAKWFRDVRVNLYGSFLCCRAVLPGMVERKKGYVINIVSSGGVGDPHPYSTSYASSKAGLMRLTEGLAAEVAEHGVKVFAVAPPAVLSEMTRFIMDDPGGRRWRAGFGRIFEEGRDHPPELVADLCIKLVSGRADRLTGRYFLATRDFDEVIGQTDTIVADDLMTLRIR
jgi:NAD(P)-dependent dehydrogenase (short-subunit alcohol dehydrogenase family)